MDNQRQQYLGLRGHKLTLAALWLVVAPSFLTYGYNQGMRAPLTGLLVAEVI